MYFDVYQMPPSAYLVEKVTEYNFDWTGLSNELNCLFNYILKSNGTLFHEILAKVRSKKTWSNKTKDLKILKDSIAIYL